MNQPPSTPASPSSILIDDDHVAFIQSGVSMTVAACGPGQYPTLVRANGCRVSPDRRRVSVFVSQLQAAPLLECIRANGLVAVAFNQASTHRTIQLKGRDAHIVALQAGDAACIVRYREAFAKDLALLGFHAPQVETLLGFPVTEVIAVSFSPSDAYVQTPGPQAGDRLEKRP